MDQKILVIDDEKSVGIALKMELENEGYEVDIETDAETALEKVKLKKYNLIFTDVNLPGTDGIEVCKAIEKISPDSTIVFMTGDVYAGPTGEEVNFIEAGNKKSYKCIYKPFVKDEFLEVAKKVLAEKG